MAGESQLTPNAGSILDAVRERLPDGRFLVAVSGGADSAVAAWSVTEIAGTDAVRAVHVHHGQDASDDLAAAAAGVAEALGIAFKRIDVKVPPGASFEGQARDVRLAALMAEGEKGEWLVTGHQADDSAETVLANLLRGAGATGLSGIAPTRGRFIRPMLDLERSLIRAAADELGLPYVDDPTNLDVQHRRNVIRNEVLPWLEDRLETPVRPAILRSADSLARDDAELESAAAQVPIGSSFGAVTLPAAVLATLPYAVAARVARRALRRAHPPYAGSTADIEAILRVADGSTGCEGLTGGLQAVREDALVAIHDVELPPLEPQPIAWGQSVDLGYWTVSVSRVGAVLPPALGRNRVVARAATVSDDAVVRSAAEGERIDIETGTKPVREAMAEAGVPVRLRSAWPVVAVGGKIAWVAGARIAEWARIALLEEPAVALSMEGNGA